MYFSLFAGVQKLKHSVLSSLKLKKNVSEVGDIFKLLFMQPGDHARQAVCLILQVLNRKRTISLVYEQNIG